MSNICDDVSAQIMELEMMIVDFVDSYKDGPQQGTEEWIKARHGVIGGSEMAVIQGINPFSNISKLIYSKVGMIPREMSIKMQWGKLFEPMICKYVEHDKNTTIYGQDIFVIGERSNQAYSPDGLGVVIMDGEPKIVLFEFKCPYSRLLKGSIPSYYIPQVKTGLDTIKITDVGLYCEGMFRRCMWHDLGTSAVYDRTLTPKDLIKTVYNPLAYGFVLFSCKRSQYNDDPGVRQLAHLYKEFGQPVMEFEDNQDEMPDMGDWPLWLFVEVMNLFEMGLLTANYSDVVIAGEDDILQDQLDEMIESAWDSNMCLFGVLPWKLLRVDYNQVEKEPGYIAQWQPTIDEITGVVDKCHKDPDNKNTIISRYMSGDNY